MLAQRSPVRTSTPLPTRLRTTSSTKSGLPLARVATKSWSGPSWSPTGRAEEADYQRPSLIVRERMDADDRLRRARHLRRPGLGPVRQQHHQRLVREVVDDVPEQIDRGVVRPVEIVDDDHQGIVLDAPFEQGARRQDDLALELLGLDVVRLGVFHAEHVAQHRRDRFGLVRAGAERPEAVDQLLPRHVERVGLVDLVRVAEERPEDAVGRLAQRRARRASDDGTCEPAFGLERREELGDEARLARSGFADRG